MSYVELSDVKYLKKNIKAFCKKELHMVDFSDLSGTDQQLMNMYHIIEATEFNPKNAIKAFDPASQKRIMKIQKKLNGSMKTEGQKMKSLELLHTMTQDHLEHEKPRWWQFIKRYAYWQESKAIKSFENKLVKLGVKKDEIFVAKHNTNAFEEMKSDYEFTLNSVQASEVVAVSEPSKAIEIDLGEAKAAEQMDTKNKSLEPIPALVQ